MQRFLALALIFIVACSPSIPPPITAVPAKSDDATVAVANPANADPLLKPPFGPFDIQTAFYISKSNDGDRVDYGLRLNEHCVPTGDDAMFPYWRELEHAPPVRSHPLKFFQYAGYGLSSLHTIERSESGGKAQVRLRQVDRPILVVTSQDKARHCTSAAYARIQGVPNARLDHIFLQVAGPTSVDFVDVYGTDPTTEKPLVERMKR